MAEVWICDVGHAFPQFLRRIVKILEQKITQGHVDIMNSSSSFHYPETKETITLQFYLLFLR